MSSKVPTTFLPPELWGVHPFYSSIVKLFNVYLDSTTSPLHLTDNTSSSSSSAVSTVNDISSSAVPSVSFLISDPAIYDSHYLYGLHPINTVAIGGTVILIENKENRTILWIDDGTGIVQCIYYHASITVIQVPPTLPTIASNTSYTTTGTSHTTSTASSTRVRNTTTATDPHHYQHGKDSFVKFRTGDRVIVYGNIGWGNRIVTYTGLVRQIYCHRIYLLSTIDKLVEFWQDTLRLHRYIYRQSLQRILPAYINLPSSLRTLHHRKVLPWITEDNDTMYALTIGLTVPIVSLSPSVDGKGIYASNNCATDTVSPALRSKKSKTIETNASVTTTHERDSTTLPHLLLIQLISIIEKLLRQYHPHSQKDKIVLEKQRQDQQKVSRYLTNYTTSTTKYNYTERNASNEKGKDSDGSDQDDGSDDDNNRMDDANDDGDDGPESDDEMKEARLYKDYTEDIMIDNDNSKNDNNAIIPPPIITDSTPILSSTSTADKAQLLNALSSGTWIMNETSSTVSSTLPTVVPSVSSLSSSVSPRATELPVYFTIHDIYFLLEKYHTDFLDTLFSSLASSQRSVSIDRSTDRSTILLPYIFDILQQLCKDGLVYVTSYSLTMQLQQQNSSTAVYYGFVSYESLIRPTIQKILTNVYQSWSTKIQAYDNSLHQKERYSRAADNDTTDALPLPPSEPTITHNELLIRLKNFLPELSHLPSSIFQRSISLLEKDGYLIILQPYVYMPIMEMINKEMEI